MEEGPSLHPPVADDSVRFKYPSWVLLDKRVYFAHQEVEISSCLADPPAVKVKTSTDQEVEISICLADPPAVSRFCVHSPKIREEDYASLPRVVSSAENLVLLSFAFRTGPRSTDLDSDLVEFFVCKAVSGGRLSIEPVPYSPAGTRHSYNAGIVPCDGGNYLVADLSPREGNLGHYDLHVFSSETSKWTSTYLQLPAPALALPRDLPSVLHKVISLRGSVVGWVDLWRGIVFCDVLEKKPVLRFIPLPTTVFNLHREGKAQEVRDVTCCNGFISFVEIEHCFIKFSIASRRNFKTTEHLDTEDLIFDKAFFTHDDLDEKPEVVHVGWKIRTMYKSISWDYWKKGHTVHVDDIFAVPGLAVQTTAFPFFGVYDDNVVYLMSKLQYEDEDSWIVGVDLEKKKLEVIKPYCAASASSFDPTVLPCPISEYMNATPRPYDELVAATSSRNRVLNNHLPMGDSIPVANTAENGVPNNHLPLGVTVLGNVQPQRNTLNVNGYHGSWNGSGYGCYQQPTQLQPPNLLPIVQPMWPSTRSGYIYAHWTVPDCNGRMLITVPLDGMKRPLAAPLVLSAPPMQPLPNSLHPPIADDSIPFKYPSWVLLDKNLYFAHHENGPTKKVKTSTDKEVGISICLANPPAASCFRVHSPNIREEDYTSLPRIVSSAENLVLLSFAFKTGPRSTEVDSDLVEFFVCKVGSGGSLSIEPVPYSPTGTRHSCHASIVPRDEGNYLVADLSPREDNLGDYDLHVFSSETSKWTSTFLQLPTPADALPRDLPSVLHKVISLGGGVVGWVDLWRGIVFCDVLEKKPVLRFIPLPSAVFNLHRKGNAQKVRDVTCCNGFISFVEIEHCFRELSIANSMSFKMTQHLDTEDLIPDKEFFTRDDLVNIPHLVPDGWKIRTMYKAISWDYWKKKHTVHFDDIAAFPPQLWNDGAMEFTSRNLKTASFPFFGVYDDNVVYLMSNVRSDDEDSWTVGVDLETMKLKVITPYWATIGSSSGPTVLPCAFSEYMNATPRPYDELVAASSSRNRVMNNHLSMGYSIPVANSAENGVPNNHFPLGDTVPDNVQPQQNTLNVDGYHGSWNGSVYGCYLQPLQPPNLPPSVQPMPPSTRSGYIFARWSDPDVHGKMLMTLPLNDMMRLAAAQPPMPVHPSFTKLLAPKSNTRAIDSDISISNTRLEACYGGERGMMDYYA